MRLHEILLEIQAGKPFTRPCVVQEVYFRYSELLDCFQVRVNGNVVREHHTLGFTMESLWADDWILGEYVEGTELAHFPEYPYY